MQQYLSCPSVPHSPGCSVSIVLLVMIIPAIMRARLRWCHRWEADRKVAWRARGRGHECPVSLTANGLKWIQLVGLLCARNSSLSQRSISLLSLLVHHLRSTFSHRLVRVCLLHLLPPAPFGVGLLQNGDIISSQPNNERLIFSLPAWFSHETADERCAHDSNSLRFFFADLEF